MDRVMQWPGLAIVRYVVCMILVVPRVDTDTPRAGYLCKTVPSVCMAQSCWKCVSREIPRPEKIRDFWDGLHK
jgi:hypothetical protein